MLLLWDEGAPYWQIALAYGFIGIGVGLAGTPASHSLTGSVPVTRAGMASGTADLQRDLGGAIMQSIFGALLTAGYASAMATRSRERARTSQTARRASSRSHSPGPRPSPSNTRSTQTRSRQPRRRRSCRAISGRTPPGLVAVVLGAALVFFMFPRKDEEERLLAEYHAADTRRAEVGVTGNLKSTRATEAATFDWPRSRSRTSVRGAVHAAGYTRPPHGEAVAHDAARRPRSRRPVSERGRSRPGSRSSVRSARRAR